MDLRGVWTTEPEFTRWLAEETNLALLSEELGIELALVQTEADVGDFNVDILAEEDGTGVKAIIENQLELTNHDHLGKLLTYASGHDAGYVIWIFKEMHDEHRRAIDWLNEHTTEDINFFAVKLELWRIEGSKPAPKFDVLCRPNKWAKTVGPGEQSETKIRQLNFWTRLNAYANEHPSTIRLQSGRAQHWLNVAVGSSSARISLWMDTQKRMLGVQLYIPDDKDLYKRLCDEKAVLEGQLGELQFRDTPGKAAYIAQYTHEFNITDVENYEKHFVWLLERADAFNKAFRPLLRVYQGNDGQT